MDAEALLGAASLVVLAGGAHAATGMVVGRPLDRRFTLSAALVAAHLALVGLVGSLLFDLSASSLAPFALAVGLVELVGGRRGLRRRGATGGAWALLAVWAVGLLAGAATVLADTSTDVPRAHDEVSTWVSAGHAPHQSLQELDALRSARWALAAAESLGGTVAVVVFVGSVLAAGGLSVTRRFGPAESPVGVIAAGVTVLLAGALGLGGWVATSVLCLVLALFVADAWWAMRAVRPRARPEHAGRVRRRDLPEWVPPKRAAVRTDRAFADWLLLCIAAAAATASPASLLAVPPLAVLVWVLDRRRSAARGARPRGPLVLEVVSL